MFKNPLKYQSGSSLSQEQMVENQLIEAVAEGLGAQPEQVKARLEQIKSDPTEIQQLQQALQLMQKDRKSGFKAILNLFAKKPQSAKFGGKIHDFICKHAKGGSVDCGCAKKMANGGPTSNNLNFIERTYDGDSNAVYVLAPERKYLPSNMMSDPTSEYQQQGGEYQGNGQVSIVDFGNGTLRIVRDIYGNPMGGEVLHGADSAAVANRALELMNKSGIKPSTGFNVKKEQEGGELSRREALRLGQENKGYNRGQARFAYQNAKQALRNNNATIENPEERLHGRALRQRAREMVAGINEAPYFLTPAQRDRYNEITYGTGTIMSKPLENGPEIVPNIEKRLAGTRPVDSMTNLSNMSFNEAFATARNAGKDRFYWAPGKYKVYTTDLASSPKIDINSLPVDVQGYLTGNPGEITIEEPEINLPDETLTFSIPSLDAGVGFPFRAQWLKHNLGNGFRSSYYKQGGKIK